jgi:hypothetical protein
LENVDSILAAEKSDPTGHALDLISLNKLYYSLPGNKETDSLEDDSLRYLLTEALRNRIEAERSKLTLIEMRDLAFRELPWSPVSKESFYGRWIREEMKKIRSEPKPDLVYSFSSKPERDDSSGTGRVLPPEYRRAIKPYQDLKDRVSQLKSSSLKREGARFRELERDFFFRDEPIADELLRFVDDNDDCGLGDVAFHQERTFLVMMSLLRERRIAEALGASLSLVFQFDRSDDPPWPVDEWRVDLLESCGFQAESMFLLQQDYEILAGRGSEAGALHCIAAFNRAGPDYERMRQLHGLAGFLVPGVPTAVNQEDPRLRISAATQQKLLETIQESMRENRSFREIDEALKVAARLRRHELKEAVRRLLKHPSAGRAELAASVLRLFGEQLPKILPAAPVRFRVCLNGQPWRHADLEYSFAGVGGSHSLRTDSEGMVTIPRDQFLDPTLSSKQMIFHKDGGLGCDDRFQYHKVWVKTVVAIPEVLDQMPDVHFSACNVPFDISYDVASTKNIHAEAKLVEIRESGRDDWTWPFFLNRGRGLPSQMTLSTIMPGRYRLYIHGPGLVRHLSQPFDVKHEMKSVPIRVEKGADVYAEILVPGNGRGAEECRLFQGWTDVTNRYSLGPGGPFVGVPKGYYQLRILSTKEYMFKHKITEWAAPNSSYSPDHRRGVDCQGLTISFKIDDKTPPVLNLGRFENKPSRSMKNKASPPRAIMGGGPSLDF